MTSKYTHHNLTSVAATNIFIAKCLFPATTLRSAGDSSRNSSCGILITVGNSLVLRRSLTPKSVQPNEALRFIRAIRLLMFGARLQVIGLCAEDQVSLIKRDRSCI